MDSSLIAGLLTLGVPLLLAGLAFRRVRAIMLFYFAMVVVGLGYLTFTGAISDIGHFALDTIGMRSPEAPVPDVPPATPMPAPAPAP